MCGIAGYFNLNIQETDRLPLLQTMCTSIFHRGPDDDGYYADEITGLGMRRLSIIDLASGKQPIHSQDNTKHIIFNGEIYNYRELRADLEKRGACFYTHSDTEVILRQYELDHTSCVNRFNGMFAFAIWDSQAKKLFLARDRMGVKPLYYYWDGKNLLFASEIKALMATHLIPQRLNHQAMWDYLTYRYVPQPETIWEGVYKLIPGHILTISANQPYPVIERYWDIPYEGPLDIKSAADYLSEFEHLFLDAVRLRLIADVPVGVLLSGGLDSSAVAAAIAEVHNASLDSFSVSFAHSPCTDELPYARQVAHQVGTNHHEIIIDVKEFMDFLPHLPYYADEPLADLASVPLYYVSYLAKQSVKVVLSGEGSDEILGGYNFDQSMRKWNRIRQFQRLPRWLRQDAAIALTQRINKRWGELLHKVNQPYHQLLLDDPMNMTHYFNSYEKKSFYREMTQLKESDIWIKEEVKRVHSDEPLHQALYVYCQSWLVEDLLMKADKMTMANSIELRVPFLDYRLVEWAARTPAWVKVAPNWIGKYETKWILRRFAKSRLPKEIIQRPKQGFPVPVYDWLGNKIKPWARDLLCSSDTRLFKWLVPQAVRNQVELGTTSQAKMIEKHRLWNLLILELWLREWNPQ